MAEFASRVALQRAVIKRINGSGQFMRPLNGLTSDAIDWWVDENGIQPGDCVYLFLKRFSDVLFKLAEKSQELITDEYLLVQDRALSMLEELDGVLHPSGV